MKTAQDPRHQRRIDTMQKLFAFSFFSENPDAQLEPILPHLAAVDAAIHDAAPEWPIEKIAKIDLAILRLAVFELQIAQKEPPKVIIDEAVELAKTYGNPSSAAFVNGALGAVVKKGNQIPSTREEPKL